MPRKPAHEQFDTLQAIQNRAFELFGRYGYEGVSIGDISAAAGLSKGAMYWHFENKTELYLRCLTRLHDLFDRHIFEPMGRCKDPVTGVILMFRGLEQFVRDPAVVNGIAGYWLMPSTPETDSLIEPRRAFERRSQATIAQVLKRGMDAGQFDLAGDLEDMSRAIITLVEAAVMPLRDQPPEEVHRMLAVLARTLFRAYAKGEEMMRLARSF